MMGPTTRNKRKEKKIKEVRGNHGIVIALKKDFKHRNKVSKLKATHWLKTLLKSEKFFVMFPLFYVFKHKNPFSSIPKRFQNMKGEKLN
jgi:hypothetical protein